MKNEKLRYPGSASLPGKEHTMTHVKKLTFIILLVMSCVSAGWTADEKFGLNTDGRAWNMISTDEKRVLVATLCTQLGKDMREYPLNSTIKGIDAYYNDSRYDEYIRQSERMTMPVALIFGIVTDCEIEVMDEHQGQAG